MRDIRFGPGEQVVAEEVELRDSGPAGPAGATDAVLHRRDQERHHHLERAERQRRSTLPHLHYLRDLAGVAVDQLRDGDVDALGSALRDGWEAKRKLASGVSNEQIDVAVERAMESGATGAKVTGAGGGGFLLVICPIEHQRAVRASLAEMRELPIKLDPLGSRVVLNAARDIWS